MSQMENMAVPAVGNMSKEELLELKKAMNAKALAKRRTRTALRVTANVVSFAHGTCGERKSSITPS